MLELLGLIANAIGWLITIFVVFLVVSFLFMISVVFVMEIIDFFKRKWGL